jgi:hypothetical protein
MLVSPTGVHIHIQTQFKSKHAQHHIFIFACMRINITLLLSIHEAFIWYVHMWSYMYIRIYAIYNINKKILLNICAYMYAHVRMHTGEFAFVCAYTYLMYM